jgi:hypothetical protein
VKKAPAITDDMIRTMVATCDPNRPAGVRDRAVLLLGRGALNRRSELADLTIGDVTVESDGVALWFTSSKTDQEAKGEEMFIPAWDDPGLDPVRATRAWLDTLHQLGVRDGAFIRTLTREGRLPSPIRATDHSDHVTGDAINHWVRERARLANTKGWEKSAAHGLRRGAAQAIADAGRDPTARGRWKAGSAVVKREYLDRAAKRSENPWAKLARPEASSTQGGLMNIRMLTIAALLTASLTACSGGQESDSKPSTKPSPAASELAALAPAWQPKLDAAAEGAFATCQTPSSDACAEVLTDIMLVVNDIESEIDVPGRGPYPESTKQIAKMQAATDKYVERGCQGDPAAEDPNSGCWGIADITIGAASLGMTLMTDDFSQPK